jgi:hypothetical protein
LSRKKIAAIFGEKVQGFLACSNDNVEGFRPGRIPAPAPPITLAIPWDTVVMDNRRHSRSGPLGTENDDKPDIKLAAQSKYRHATLRRAMPWAVSNYSFGLSARQVPP